MGNWEIGKLPACRQAGEIGEFYKSLIFNFKINSISECKFSENVAGSYIYGDEKEGFAIKKIPEDDLWDFLGECYFNLSKGIFIYQKQAY
ncbi:MAG TPA: hypothetical protein ENJ95_12685 [Bacteroidetes bacterium]|nr:hypothetical protein [Bacteroidota bacterium]